MDFLQQGGITMAEAPPRPSSTTSEHPTSHFNQRTRRQLGLFCAGAGFFALTSLITRRALVRRYKATVPRFYQPNNAGNPDINGAVEAFEALSIATINVASVGIMTTGGLLYAFDISSMEDMRRKVRVQIGLNATRADQDAEEKMVEEWFATMLKGKKENGVEDPKGKDEKS